MKCLRTLELSCTVKCRVGLIRISPAVFLLTGPTQLSSVSLQLFELRLRIVSLPPVPAGHRAAPACVRRVRRAWHLVSGPGPGLFRLRRVRRRLRCAGSAGCQGLRRLLCRLLRSKPRLRRLRCWLRLLGWAWVAGPPRLPGACNPGPGLPGPGAGPGLPVAGPGLQGAEPGLPGAGRLLAAGPRLPVAR